MRKGSLCGNRDSREAPLGQPPLGAGGRDRQRRGIRRLNIYATFSPIFAAQFFPGNDSTAALLSTLAVFAVGFVMRPIGGAILGAYVDRHGRKRGLALTAALMAAGSLMIAVCPGYSTIGVVAPIVLLLARLVQGFSNGGEFGASSAFLVEKAPDGRRAFFGSWQQVTVAAAHVIVAGLGSLLTFSLSDEAMHSWGWRIAFAIGALLGVIGLWLRRAVRETDAFEQTSGRSGGTFRPLVDLLRHHPAHRCASSASRYCSRGWKREGSRGVGQSGPPRRGRARRGLTFSEHLAPKRYGFQSSTVHTVACPGKTFVVSTRCTSSSASRQPSDRTVRS